MQRLVWTRLRSDEHGTVTIIAALSMTVMLAAAGIAVDIGAIYLARRTAQGAADLAALSAAADLSKARAAALSTLAANGLPGEAGVDVVIGRYEANAALPAGQRFVPGALPANAALVSVVRPQRLYFAKPFIKDVRTYRVQALATTGAVGAFSVGTRLLALRDGIANALFGSLLGGSVNLSVMDYNALADADVSLGEFLGAAASELNLTAASYDQVLDSRMTAGNILDVAANLADRKDQTSASAALRMLSDASSTTTTLPLRALIDLGAVGAAAVGSKAPGLDAQISLLELARTTATLSNGERQVDVASQINVPGLLSLSVSLAVGEPPQRSGWVAAGAAGAKVWTAQTRLRVVAEVGGTGGLAGIKIKIPLAIDVAHAQANLAEVRCAEGGGNEAKIAARPGIASIWLGDFVSDISDFSAPPMISEATLVKTPLLRVNGSSHITASESDATELTFAETDVTAKTVKRVETDEILASAVSSLMRDARFEVKTFGLGIGLPGALQSELAKLLEKAAQPLDAVVAELLETLGLHLGEADVRVHGITCRGAVLAG